MSGREVREYTNLTDPKDRKLGKGKIDDEDVTFQRMVAKMQDVAGERGGYLHGRGALDSDDLLYLKEQMEAEEDAERLLRRTEKRAFAAFKKAAVLADSTPAVPAALCVDARPKSDIRQRDLLKNIVGIKPKRPKVGCPSQAAESDIPKQNQEVSASKIPSCQNQPLGEREKEPLHGTVSCVQPPHPHRRSRRLASPRPEMSRHHHHHDPPPPACCSCGCVCACSAPAPCGGGYYPAPAQAPPASDQLLHAIAAHLLINSAPPPPPPPQPQQPPPPAAHHANLHSSYAYQYQQQQQGPHAYPHPPPQHQHQQQGPQHHAHPQPPAPPPQQQQLYPPDHGQLLLHSLLRRVAALETSLPHSYFPTPTPIPQPHPNTHHRHHRAPAHQEEDDDDPPSPPPRRARGGRPPPPSERELAARTIQEHFRRFLARRSRTLRQLKELAILRSKAASLRGSLSGSGRGRCKDPVAVSEAAMGLLLHLDGIQGGDPMIREGKRAVSRELSRILEFVDKVLVKDHEEMPLDNAEYPEGCHAAPVVSCNKKVSFRCNDAQNEEDESSESSSSVEADERKCTSGKSIANGKSGLAAPAPVQMESRRAAGEMR